MKRFLPLLSIACFVTAGAAAQERTERLALERGVASASGQIKGDGSVQYQLAAEPGQQLTVQLATNNPSNYFNVERGGGAEAICQGALTGNVCMFRTEPGTGYVVDVFLMRNAARRGESAQYTLSIAQGAAQPAPPPPAAATADKEAAAAAVAACKSALALKSGRNAVFVLPLSHVPAAGGQEVFLSLDGAQWLCMTDARGNVNRLDRR
ncbi:hypothetical protein [Pseudorhodoferax sp.]|uniref:hypothetical protein n=1 Tax=Pseudorhodoferax sp. TaxID=1993553 RepID=UPI002DD6B4E2|nr:hypothetical protein [Pseudorhodoferax sp.]